VDCCLLLGCVTTPDKTKPVLVGDSGLSDLPLMPRELPLTMEKHPLTLSLTPVVASQLVQMFGPSGTGIKTIFIYINR